MDILYHINSFLPVLEEQHSIWCPIVELLGAAAVIGALPGLRCPVILYPLHVDGYNQFTVTHNKTVFACILLCHHVMYLGGTIHHREAHDIYPLIKHGGIIHIVIMNDFSYMRIW